MKQFIPIIVLTAIVAIIFTTTWCMFDLTVAGITTSIALLLSIIATYTYLEIINKRR